MPCLRHFILWKRDPVPMVQEAGWATELVWMGMENLALPGFKPRAFQPVASFYTDCPILASSSYCSFKKSMCGTLSLPQNIKKLRAQT
jgi:hypothetical protein